MMKSSKKKNDQKITDRKLSMEEGEPEVFRGGHEIF